MVLGKHHTDKHTVHILINVINNLARRIKNKEENGGTMDKRSTINVPWAGPTPANPGRGLALHSVREATHIGSLTRSPRSAFGAAKQKWSGHVNYFLRGGLGSRGNWLGQNWAVRYY